MLRIGEATKIFLCEVLSFLIFYSALCKYFFRLIKIRLIFKGLVAPYCIVRRPINFCMGLFECKGVLIFFILRRS